MHIKDRLASKRSIHPFYNSQKFDSDGTSNGYMYEMLRIETNATNSPARWMEKSIEGAERADRIDGEETQFSWGGKASFVFSVRHTKHFSDKPYVRFLLLVLLSRYIPMRLMRLLIVCLCACMLVCLSARLFICVRATNIIEYSIAYHAQQNEHGIISILTQSHERKNFYIAINQIDPYTIYIHAA